MFSWLTGSRTPMKDEIDRFSEAEEIANDRGIERPHSSTQDRMQCAPDWNSVVDAADRGIALAETMPDGSNADAGFFGIIYGAAQFVKDSWSIQECMDKQDEKYEEELAEYVEEVRTLADESRPTPITPAYSDRSMFDDRPNTGMGLGICQPSYENCMDSSSGNGYDSGPSPYGGGAGGGGDLMNIEINCSGGSWESNGDGTSSCKM